MKESSAHLPKNKQKELRSIVSAILDQCDDVEMIILFGSYARGNYKEEADLKPDRKSGHKSDYDIFAVTGEKSTATNVGLWRKITKRCNSLNLSAHVRIIVHDIQELNIKLAEGQYFYSDVRKEGCMLYDSGNAKLANKRKLKSSRNVLIYWIMLISGHAMILITGSVKKIWTIFQNESNFCLT